MPSPVMYRQHISCQLKHQTFSESLCLVLNYYSCRLFCSVSLFFVTFLGERGYFFIPFFYIYLIFENNSNKTSTNQSQNGTTKKAVPISAVLQTVHIIFKEVMKDVIWNAKVMIVLYKVFMFKIKKRKQYTLNLNHSWSCLAITFEIFI